VLQFFRFWPKADISDARSAPQDYLARLQESREELQSRIAEMLSGA
jgi:hypothetical protein